MHSFCCKDLKKLFIDYNTPIVINQKDLSIEALGYHEVYRDNEDTGLRLNYCPFCGIKTKGPITIKPPHSKT